MAPKRRGGGFRPPELRGTLGTLLRTTLQQAGVVRDALERGARTGRERLDEARASRRRQDALAELGELVLELIRRGEIDVAELPEARALIRTLDELDAEADADASGSAGGAGGDDDEPARPPVRRRFDPRGGDDGTVSSSQTWAPPTRARTGSSTPPKAASPARVWRPPADDLDVAPDAEPEPPSRRLPVVPPHPHRKGGISFEDDDLADYMHPDDVPPKDAPGSDS